MRWVISICAAVTALALSGAASAAPPTNDSFGGATSASVPSSVGVDLTEATLEPGESQFCWPQARTAWFVVQPASDGLVRVASSGFGDRVVTLYRDNGSGLGGLTQIGCAFPWSEIVTTLQAGVTYYVQVGAPPWSSIGNVDLQLDVVPPPPNDAFANAKSVSAVPYADTVDMRAATVQAGEPTQPAGVFQPFTGTSWYSYTTSQTESLMVTRIGCCASGHNIAVYTGSAVDSLTPVSVARPFDGRAIFTAAAGTTYRIQNGVSGFPFASQLGLQIEKTPNPVASMFVNIGDPSIYETVGFGFSGFDPAGVGIDSWSWSFGDGSGATGPNPSHRYAADGDYEVRLTVTTPDGRTAVDKRTVSVRTHDVAIVKLAVPQSGRAGQTKTISVNVANKRDVETVTVTLFRSVPGSSGSWEAIAQSTQTLAAKSGNKTTSYVFSYTFTAADATVGKVSFRASASINGARDALPADNESVSPPTSVSP